MFIFNDRLKKCRLDEELHGQNDGLTVQDLNQFLINNVEHPDSTFVKIMRFAEGNEYPDTYEIEVHGTDGVFNWQPGERNAKLLGNGGYTDPTRQCKVRDILTDAASVIQANGNEASVTDRDGHQFNIIYEDQLNVVFLVPPLPAGRDWNYVRTHMQNLLAAAEGLRNPEDISNATAIQKADSLTTAEHPDVARIKTLLSIIGLGYRNHEIADNEHLRGIVNAPAEQQAAQDGNDEQIPGPRPGELADLADEVFQGGENGQDDGDEVEDADIVNIRQPDIEDDGEEEDTEPHPAADNDEVEDADIVNINDPDATDENPNGNQQNQPAQVQNQQPAQAQQNQPAQDNHEQPAQEQPQSTNVAGFNFIEDWDGTTPIDDSFAIMMSPDTKEQLIQNLRRELPANLGSTITNRPVRYFHINIGTPEPQRANGRNTPYMQVLNSYKYWFMFDGSQTNVVYKRKRLNDYGVCRIANLRPDLFNRMKTQPGNSWVYTFFLEQTSTTLNRNRSFIWGTGWFINQNNGTATLPPAVTAALAPNAQDIQNAPANQRQQMQRQVQQTTAEQRQAQRTANRRMQIVNAIAQRIRDDIAAYRNNRNAEHICTFIKRPIVKASDHRVILVGTQSWTNTTRGRERYQPGWNSRTGYWNTHGAQTHAIDETDIMRLANSYDDWFWTDRSENQMPFSEVRMMRALRRCLDPSTLNIAEEQDELQLTQEEQQRLTRAMTAVNQRLEGTGIAAQIVHPNRRPEYVTVAGFPFQQGTGWQNSDGMTITVMFAGLDPTKYYGDQAMQYLTDSGLAEFITPAVEAAREAYDGIRVAVCLDNGYQQA